MLSDKNKFLTTFNEKVSAKNTATAIRPPHELRKFQDLRILDIAAGLHHILLFAVSRVSPSISLDITSSDANENIPIHALPLESDASVKSSENQQRSIGLTHQNTSEFKNIISPRPLLAKETLEAIQADVQIDTNIPIDEPVASKIEIHSNTSEILANSDKEKPIGTIEIDEKQEKLEFVTSKVVETLEKVEHLENIDKTEDKQNTVAQNTNDEIPNDHLKLNEQDTAMDMVSKGVSNIGDSFMNDIKSIANAGEEKLNDLAKETEKTIKEVPKNVIDYVKTSVGLEKDEADHVMDANMDDKENTIKELPKQLTDSKISMSEIPPIDSLEPDENETVKHNNKLNRAMAQDDSNETIIDDFKDDAVDNEVKFINNGVDVSSTSNILQAMKDEMNEMSNDVKNKSDELTMKYDGIINDELNATKDSISTKMFHMKNGKKIMKFPWIHLAQLN